MPKHIYFITGASGVGKTTLVKQLEKKYSQQSSWTFLHFDSIGIPSKEEMEKEFGSTELWQKAATKKWITTMLTEYASKDVVVLEGQANLDFIKEGFDDVNYTDYTTVLIDCNEGMMHHRLIGERMQPELATEEMSNWRSQLRAQGEKYGVPIIDTQEMDKDSALEAFENIVKEDGLL